MFKKSSTDKKQDKMTDSSFIRIIMTSILGVAMCILCLCSSTWAWFSHSISSENTNKITAANDFNLTITVTYDSSTISSGSSVSLLNSEDDNEGSASTSTEDSASASTEDSASASTETETGSDSTDGNVDTTESSGNTSNGQTPEDQNNASDSSTIVTLDVTQPVDLIANVEYTVTLELPKDSASGYCVINIGGTNYYSPYIARHDSDTPHTVSFKLICKENQTGVTFTPYWGIYSGNGSVADGGSLTIISGTTTQQ